MNFDCKIASLQRIIEAKLVPLISEKCILTDLPYHDNLGDVLIWQGEVDFIHKIGVKLLSCTSSATFLFPPLNKDITILLHGGGNFGDLYSFFHEFKKKVIENYPDNRIVMFPQSVWYNDMSLVEEDAQCMARHKDLHLCARDQWSYDFMKKYFYRNNLYLVPDMAFCIDDRRLHTFQGNETGRELFLRRLDKELTNSTPLILSEKSDIHDWPTVENKPLKFYNIERAYRFSKRLCNIDVLYYFVNKCIDSYANRFVKDSLVNIGCEFLSPYSKVTTTRLHAMILSILLHKPVEYIDNSTGKLSAFAHTWLNDLSDVKLYGE